MQSYSTRCEGDSSADDADFERRLYCTSEDFERLHCKVNEQAASLADVPSAWADVQASPFSPSLASSLLHPSAALPEHFAPDDVPALLDAPSEYVASAPQPDDPLVHPSVFTIFGVNIALPAGSTIVNRTRKIVEVAGNFPPALVHELQSCYQPNLLLIDLVDGLLVFQIPSSNATDCLNIFDVQLMAYLRRRGKVHEISSKGSSSLFLVTGSSHRLCPDYTIHDSRGYFQKVQDALASHKTIPEGVTIYLTIGMQSFSQSEDVIRDGCRREAREAKCISVALLVKTGYVEIFSSTGALVSAEHNPSYIDIGSYTPYLPGLRLYLQPLRDAGCWDFPNPHSFRIKNSPSSLMEAISAENFDLAEGIVNFMNCSIREKGPLQLAAKKAVQQVPRALYFVDYLLQNGAVIDTDTRSISTLLVAVASKDGPLNALLQRYGAAASLIVSADDLVYAVRSENEDLIRLLIQAGCDPSVPSSNGMLALVEAIPTMALVDTILDAAGHVDVTAKDRFGRSALKYAKNLKAQEIVKKLKEKVKLQGGGRKKTTLAKLISKTLFKRGSSSFGSPSTGCFFVDSRDSFFLLVLDDNQIVAPHRVVCLASCAQQHSISQQNWDITIAMY